MPDSQLTLASIAILRVDIDSNNRDYLDYLNPFVIDVLNDKKKNQVDDIEIQKEILSRFGLNIPSPVIQLVLKRFVRKDYLELKYKFYFVKNSLPISTIQKDRSDAKAKISNVINGFREFSEKNFQKNLTETQSSDLLLSLLKKFGIGYINAFYSKSALPNGSDLQGEDEIITCAFITELYKNKDSMLDEFIILLKGVLLSNALLCQDLNLLKKTYKSVTFLLDTSLILNLLKVHGVISFNITKELIDLIHNLKGKVACFEHNIEEVKNVLESANNNFDDPEVNMPVLEAMRKASMPKSDLILIKGDIKEKLKKIQPNIQFIRAPFLEKRYGITIDEKDLQEALSEIQYKGNEAINYDIKSIKAVYDLKNNIHSTNLEDSEFVLVTNNTGVAKAGDNYQKTKLKINAFPPVITDFSLSSYSWLKAPLGAVNLPKTELLALCYSTLEPSCDLWTKYIREINRLLIEGEISADDHAILRSTYIAQDELMKLTRGHESEFRAENVLYVLDKVKKELFEEKQIIIDEKNAKIESFEKEKQELKTKLYWEAKNKAKYWSIFVSIILTLLLLIISFFGTPVWGLVRRLLDISDSDGDKIVGYFSSLIVAGFIFGVIPSCFGYSPVQIYKNTNAYLFYRLIQGYYKKYIGEPYKSE